MCTDADHERLEQHIADLDRVVADLTHQAHLDRVLLQAHHQWDQAAVTELRRARIVLGEPPPFST